MPLLEFLDSSWFNGWWIVFWFILFSAFIVVVAKVLTSSLECITNKIKISKIFMGGVVMSLITSFPELVGSIYGAMNSDPMFAIYNETGSSTIQIFLLSLTMLVFFFVWLFKNKKNNKPKTICEIYDQCLLKIEQENNVLIILLICFYTIFILFTSIPQVGEYLYIPGWNVSIISLVPFVMWIGFVIWTLCKKNKSHKIQHNNSIFNKLNIWWLWLIFFVFSVGLIWFSYVNSGVVDKMSNDVFNIPEQSAATILLSIPSALPETVTMIFLFKNREYGLGFSTLVGSGLTNSSFMFYVDCIDRRAIFKEFFDTFLKPETAADRDYLSSHRMQYWIPLVFAIYLVLFITTRKKVAKTNTYATIGLSSIVLMYIVGFSLISTLIL